IHQAPDNTVLSDAHEVPKWVKVAPFVAMLGGLIVAYIFYIAVPSLPARWAAVNRPLYLFLLNKWYFDEIYDAVFVRPAQAIGRVFWKLGDIKIIDGGINGLALGIIPFLTRLAGRAQSGYVFHYAFAMVVGVVALITWISLSIGG
ncbi:MAG: NADH-quinone oxidoreductase subunit L, partial [Rhodobacteraceae bacterium]|nr:NADH-quinone oxidoreductase subunit L [Paracoccaceae bacterium]